MLGSAREGLISEDARTQRDRCFGCTDHCGEPEPTSNRKTYADGRALPKQRQWFG
jgi:hypothetical protein